MSKLSRQNLILDLVQQETVANQEQLRKLLVRQGVEVTQATLSRDINELSLVKTSAGYSVSHNELPTEPAFHSAGRLIREFVIEVREAQNLLVIKTATGSAQPVAAALDSEGWAEIVGTVGGDDTILVISQSKKNAHRTSLRIKGMMQ
jgi:transcriptional regulator of arginine metabolism